MSRRRSRRTGPTAGAAGVEAEAFLGASFFCSGFLAGGAGGAAGFLPSAFAAGAGGAGFLPSALGAGLAAAAGGCGLAAGLAGAWAIARLTTVH